MNKWTDLREISELTQIDATELMYLLQTIIPSDYMKYEKGQVMICDNATWAIISAANISADTEQTTMLEALSTIMIVEKKRRESEKQAG